MYKNIELSSRGALQSLRLEGLGQIVVVCGKNNSGKTTLLRAIESGKQYLKPNEFDTAKFHRAATTHQGQPWADYFHNIDQTPNYQDVWYEGDADKFVAQSTAVFRNTHFMADRPNLDANIIRAEYESQIPNLTSVYISPKRNLQLVGKIETGSTVTPDGDGLLNFLFNAANQFEGTNLRNILTKVLDFFRTVSGGFEFTIRTQENNELQLFFRFERGTWISAEDCGLGLQDLLVILYHVVYPGFGLVLLEEPESHLHPEMQRKLLSICKAQSDRQFFLSTHSSVFLDLTLVDSIYHTEISDGVIAVSNDTRRAALLDSLGYSVTDNLVSDLIILVEGPSDKPVLEEFLRQKGLYASYGIKIWPLGGDIMDQLDLSVFSEKYDIIGLIDTDPGSRKVRKRFKDKCAELKIPVHQLERYAIENYFTIPALRAVFPNTIPAALTHIDPKTPLESQIHWSVKKQNDKIAKEMTLDDIRGTDLFGFLEKVEAKLKK